ncbi:putative endopolygalacturonase D [Thelonectria olida]|uniref:endo-polygalacturonase n=1 Tax=Thelonectria olida TaxID=1576542 RepID=A0A9P8VWC6_9HYPO|nr:putative endopolygalacturonase D [Thelonectria olida]
MKSFYLLTAAVPSVLCCSNPKTHACGGAFVASAAEAASFCATFTASVVTATDSVPSALLDACDGSVKHLSSACDCYVTGGTGDGAGSPTAVASTPVATLETSAFRPQVSSTPVSTLVTYTKPASTPASDPESTPVSDPESTAAAEPAATSASGASGDSSVVVAGDACTVTEYAQISSAVASCTNIVLSGVSMPASSTLDLQSLQTGAVVTFEGTTSFGTTADEDFDPIVVSGHSITIQGAEGHVIDGNGAAYWDGQGSNGGSSKPDHFFVVKKTYDSKITGLNIQNWPTHCFYVNGNYNLEMSDITLDNSDGDAANSESDGDPAAHNTDGFDISSSDTVTLSNIWVHNQDDCVAVTSGSNIVIDGIYCYGGHGLSIGSIGGKSNNTVDGVTFANAQVVDSQNGCRIKSNSGTTGTVANVTYRNVTLSGITKYGIDVQQDYLNGGPTGEPTNGVSISGITFEDVSGTATGSAYNYYVLCGDGSCSDFTYTDVSITGGSSGGSCNYPSSGCPS